MLTKHEVQQLIRENSERVQYCEKQERSLVWQRFETLAVDGNPVPFVACKSCRIVYTYNKKDGVSSIANHRCGPMKGQQSIRSFARTQPKAADVTACKRRLTDAAVQFCALDQRPYAIVEGKGFQIMAQALMDVRRDIGSVDVASVLPSAVTVARAAHQMATKKRSELKEHLTEVSPLIKLSLKCTNVFLPSYAYIR